MNATVEVLARPRRHQARLRTVGTDRLGASDANFALAVKLGAGQWQIEVRFQDPEHVVVTTSRSISGPSAPNPLRTSASARPKAKDGTVSALGLVGPVSGGRVELLAFQTSGGSIRHPWRTAATKGKVTLRTKSSA